AAASARQTRGCLAAHRGTRQLHRVVGPLLARRGSTPAGRHGIGTDSDTGTGTWGAARQPVVDHAAATHPEPAGGGSPTLDGRPGARARPPRRLRRGRPPDTRP